MTIVSNLSLGTIYSFNINLPVYSKICTIIIQITSNSIIVSSAGRKLHEDEESKVDDDSILRLRPNDFEIKRENSLLKSSKLFAPIVGREDVFNKSNKSNQQKIYYLRGHSVIEYFAMLVRLGFHTPKCRIVDQTTSEERDTIF